MNFSIKNTQLFLLGFLAFTSNVVMAQSNQNISFKGNSFELFTQPRDTFYIENIETGQREMKITRVEVIPIKMNGAAIAKGDEMQSPPLPERSMDEYFIDLVNQNKNLFNQLSDGQYRINPRHFVISKEGKIMYYTFEGVEKMNEPKENAIIQAIENGEVVYYKFSNDVKVPLDPKYFDPAILKELSIKSEINQFIKNFIDSGKIRFEAGEKDGNKILGIANGAHVWITVKNHQVTVDI